MKKILLITLGFLLLSGVVLIAFLSRFDIDDHRDAISNYLTENTDLTFELKGKIEMELDGQIYLSVRDLSISDSLGVLCTADSAFLKIPLVWPGGYFKVSRVIVYRPHYHYRSAGIIPLHGKRHEIDKASLLPSFSLDSVLIDSIKVTNGIFTLYDDSSKHLLHAEGIQTKGSRFELNLHKSILHSFNVSADASFERITAFDLKGRNGRLKFKMKKGFLYFKSDYLRQGPASTTLLMNLNPKKIVFKLKANTSEENLSELFPNKMDDWIKGNYHGNLDVIFSLGSNGIDLKSLTGKVQLESFNTRFYGLSLDKMVKRFKKTQSFSFKDLGSVMLLGPWGLALSKGGDYAAVARVNKKDSTQLDLLHCDFAVDSGLLHFQDVAFRTEKNRVALMGRIDPIKMEYRKFSYALLDEEGCSEIREEFNGPFEQASNEGISNIALLFGPVTNLFESTSSVILRNDCDRVYEGSVEAPPKSVPFLKRFFGLNGKKVKSEKEEKK